MKLLILDDIQFTLSLLSKELSMLGHSVTAIRHAEDALLQLKYQCDYDAVLCDYDMPKLNGIEFYNQCQKEIATRADKKLPPFILFSAHSSDYIPKTAYETGFVEFIQKPFSRKELDGLLIRACHSTLKTKRPKALIYSDSTQLQQTLESYIPKACCQFVTITTPYQALSYYKNNPDISAILVEQTNMPVSALSFFDLCQSNKRYDDKGELKTPTCLLFTRQTKENLQDVLPILKSAYAMGIKDIYNTPIVEKSIPKITEAIGISLTTQYENSTDANTILLAESLTFSRVLIKKSLEQSGYAVKAVSNDTELLNCIKESPQYKAILIDYNMPETNAFDVLERCKALEKNQSPTKPIYILLHYIGENSKPLDPLKAIENGFNAVLKKPVDKLTLYRLLEEGKNHQKPKLLF